MLITCWLDLAGAPGLGQLHVVLQHILPICTVVHQIANWGLTARIFGIQHPLCLQKVPVSSLGYCLHSAFRGMCWCLYIIRRKYICWIGLAIHGCVPRSDDAYIAREGDGLDPAWINAASMCCWQALSASRWCFVSMQMRQKLDRFEARVTHRFIVSTALTL